MMTMRLGLLLGSTLALAACGGGGGASNASNATATSSHNQGTGRPVTNARASSAALSLDGEGLRAVDPANGHTTPLGFGAAMDDTVGRVATILGARPTSDTTNSECGAGPTRIIQFANGLRLLGQGNRFQGWEVDRGGVGTMDGIDVGVARARIDQNQSQVEQTTLGTEFSIGDGETAIRGLLSARGADGRVTAMWAGLTCHMT